MEEMLLANIPSSVALGSVYSIILPVSMDSIITKTEGKTKPTTVITK